jgi:GntR family transcriptional regulator
MWEIEMENNNRLDRIGWPEHQTLTNATVETVRAAIKSGNFPPGSQLPPEMQMADQLGVSRTTLREAYRVLENEHLIERRRGLGTFISTVPILKELGSNYGITEMILESKRVPNTSYSEVRREKALSEVASALQLPKGEPIIAIERIRTANGTPVVVSIDILPADLISEQNLRRFSDGQESLYQFLADELHIFVAHGVARLWPTIANKEMMTKLAIPKGTPLLVVSQIDYDASNKPVLYSIEHHLGDMFRFIVSRRGPY